jgi:hypothetical protein
MKITHVNLYSSDQDETTESITFRLAQGKPTDRYIARTILGIDPEDVIPKFYGFALNGNGKFYDAVLKERLIVIRLVLNPRFRIDESYSDIRDALYKVILANRFGLVTLHFNAGATTVCRASGRVIKFEVPYFNEVPEVQITVKCDDPMLRAINPVDYAPGEFDTANPVTIPDSISTAPHGFTFDVTINAAIPTFTIQDDPTTPTWMFKITPAGGFLAGDRLYFSSEFSNKYLYIVRGANTIQLMDTMNPTSIWPILFPGQNIFHFVDLASMTWNSLTYYPAYWGV